MAATTGCRSSTSIRALRGVASTPDASRQELSRTVVGAVRTSLPSSNRFGVWLSREGRPNEEAYRE
jgi:hypothetical protein